MRFEITPGFISLKNRNEYEFSHIVNKLMKPGELFKELYNCGVNLLPVDKDTESANILLKET